MSEYQQEHQQEHQQADAGEPHAPRRSEPPEPEAPEPARPTALITHADSDKLSLSLQQAVGGFVDEPRHAVEDADRVLDEAMARVTQGIEERRRTLRATWQEQSGATKATGTEELRVTLRQYRELVEQLLRL